MVQYTVLPIFCRNRVKQLIRRDSTERGSALRVKQQRVQFEGLYGKNSLKSLGLFIQIGGKSMATRVILKNEGQESGTQLSMDLRA